MNESPTISQDGFNIEISSDRMKVSVIIAADADVSAAAVITALREMKVARFDDGMIIDAMQHRKGEAMSLEVAAATAPVDDRPERVDFRVPISDALSSVSTKVAQGDRIAIISPAVSGTDGVDVFGEKVERKKSESPLQIGRNLLLEKGEVCSIARGHLRLHQNVLSVEPLLEVRGDDGTAAPIAFDGDVAIKGSLSEGRPVQVTGSLAISGALEAIPLKTGGSVVVQGGVIGKQKGRYMIGGDLRCRFITGGFIFAANDVFVQSDITDSRITCGGRLVVERGVIFGGAVAANSGVTCQTIGHPSGTHTLIEAGEGVAGRSLLTSATAQIEANRKRILSVRATIAPLVKVMKTLTAAQREKVTELLYEADELESATDKLVADMENQTRLLAKNANAEILVENAVYPGVIVRFPSVKAAFTTALKGPFLLAPYKLNGITEVVLTSKTDHSRIILPSQPIDSAIEAAASDGKSLVIPHPTQAA